MSPHGRILLGLVAGGAAGITASLVGADTPALEHAVRYGTEPLGRLWLSGLVMVVIPLILGTLATGVADLGSLRRLGRIGAVTLLCFLGLTLLSTLLGLGLTQALRPGLGLDPAVKAQLLGTYRGQVEGAMGLSQTGFGIDLLANLIPRNPIKAAASGDMLAVIVFALLVGIALAMLPREKGEPVHRFLESLGHVCVAIIELFMRAAPVGVFCLIFTVTARFGFGILASLLRYVVTVLLGLLLFQVVVYPLVVWGVARRRPVDFFRRVRLVLVTAFTTSSSNATLPTTLRVAQEQLGVSPPVAGFVLPLGATMNMNGTALFEGATVLFLAQVFGVHLTLPQQGVVVLMSVVTAIGVAGVPGGSIPLLMSVLAMVGVPPEGIAIVLGVDRLLDMCRTVLNVTGDLVTATVVERFEGAGTLAVDPPSPAG
jgi:DAACS family dicarboxylate/amino acid:cation (Na+ or H+) symporter